MIRKLLPIVLACALLVGLAVPALAAITSKSAQVGNFYIRPGKVTIKRGTKVVWHFKSGYHDVTVKRGPVKFTSKGRLFGTSWSHVFTKAGTYHLYCKIHPSMTETVIVK